MSAGHNNHSGRPRAQLDGRDADPLTIGPLNLPEETVRGMLEAEGALMQTRERCRATDDPEVKSELAADALEHVERQLQLVRAHRRDLDSLEGKLWSRRNRLEGILIRARGLDWWHARAASKTTTAT